MFFTRGRTLFAALAVLLVVGCAGPVAAVGYALRPSRLPRPISPRAGTPASDPTNPRPTSRFPLPFPSLRSELKPIDFGEVVAAEHHNVVGTVAMKLMPDVRTSDVKITLVVNGGQKIATRVKPDGSFALLDVPPGSHLMDTFALGYTFPPLRVKVQPDGHVRAEYAEDPTEWFEAPLQLRPVSAAAYFEPRQGFTLRSLMRNPMFLMVSLTVLMAWVMPKLMEGMDPEELKAIQDKMGNQPSMSDILSGKAFDEAGKSEKGPTGAERRAANRQ